ncbi:putative peptidase (DUF1758) [Popillia japonica]|uniref:Peptidase (DUF1758) n=1 Tax=Popillia japonica TaxID=7064 RepID=A0AAW1MED9_POPJA
MKLDVSSKKEWDEATSNDVNILPTYDDLITFLNKRCRLLGKSSLVNVANEKEPVNKGKTNSLVSVNKPQCNYCNKSHFTSQCDELLNLSQKDITCHHVAQSIYAKSAKNVISLYFSILHIEDKPQIDSKTEDSLPSTSVVTAHSSTKNAISQVLLSTVCVRVSDSLGKWHHCKALLDSGSQSNFITSDFHAKLNLPRHPIQSTVLGINQATTNLNYRTNVHIHSVHGAYETTLSCLIIKKITENMPMTSFDASYLNIPNNINLANPMFNEESQIQLGKGNPTLQKTRLGWIISGPMSIPHNLQPQQVSCNLSINLENLVEKFWSIEECNFKQECNFKRKWSVREQECETHFVNTVSRDHTGRFRVSIPFNSEKNNLGESRQLALKRFFACERRLNQNPDLKQDYVNFMTEYEELGHMRLINEADDAQGTQSYYFPHHAVIKASSTTTKTRVVFDGSAKTTTGVSLNDAQKVGPVIQDDIFTLLMRFRQYAFVLTADVEKMYRQILISNDDLKYHRIFWRSDSSKSVKCYELQTITYGTASASFLATRCLQQLAIDFRSQCPEASNRIEHDFYMDDLLTGANSIHQLDKLRREITEILDSAGYV